VHKPVGGHDRFGWLINEAFLQVLPLLGVPRTGVLGQKLDVKLSTLPL
jgi:hypothetical protein